MVDPALPALQRDLHASSTWVTWLLTGFLLVSANRDADLRQARRPAREGAAAVDQHGHPLLRLRPGDLRMEHLDADRCPRDPGCRRRGVRSANTIPGTTVPKESAFTDAFWIAAVAAGVAAGIAIFVTPLLRARSRSRRPSIEMS